jgi:mRNA-degrading endonuclease YafQ of YafQ-DinJ toxin-antitoxin module
MPGATRYRTLDFTDTFFESFGDRGFSDADRRAFRKALRLLDANEKHPSLRVHELQGNLAGLWSASASDVLRMTFERLKGGRKVMMTCSRHYDR